MGDRCAASMMMERRLAAQPTSSFASDASRGQPQEEQRQLPSTGPAMPPAFADSQAWSQPARVTVTSLAPASSPGTATCLTSSNNPAPFPAEERSWPGEQRNIPNQDAGFLVRRERLSQDRGMLQPVPNAPSTPAWDSEGPLSARQLSGEQAALVEPRWNALPGATSNRRTSSLAGSVAAVRKFSCPDPSEIVTSTTGNTMISPEPPPQPASQIEPPVVPPTLSDDGIQVSDEPPAFLPKLPPGLPPSSWCGFSKSHTSCSSTSNSSLRRVQIAHEDEGIPLEEPEAALSASSTAIPAELAPPIPQVLVEEMRMPSPSSVARHRHGRRIQRTKKAASYFVSAPGAFSSDTRDASIHQGRFDMHSVLQTQLRQEVPCLVCDVSGGQLMVTNSECEDLFESTNDNQLVQNDIFTLIYHEDRHIFEHFFTYILISEQAKMDRKEIRINTLQNNMRRVSIVGTQLIGMWWQLEFAPLEDAPTVEVG